MCKKACKAFEVPGTNLAGAHFFVSFSLSFSNSKLSEIIWAERRKRKKKKKYRLTRKKYTYPFKWALMPHIYRYSIRTLMSTIIL